MNLKPYRTKALKLQAKERYYRADNGSFRAPVDVPTLIHGDGCESHRCYCRSFKRDDVKEKTND